MPSELGPCTYLGYLYYFRLPSELGYEQPRLLAQLIPKPPELGHETSAKMYLAWERERALEVDTHVEFERLNEVYYVPLVGLFI